jgi:hypothetical protein
MQGSFFEIVFMARGRRKHNRFFAPSKRLCFHNRDEASVRIRGKGD